MEIIVRDIYWETDGEQVDLPEEVTIDTAAEGIEVAPLEIADWLSDRYGWCVNSFSYGPVSSPRP